jgi:hypothetical protein
MLLRCMQCEWARASWGPHVRGCTLGGNLQFVKDRKSGQFGGLGGTGGPGDLSKEKVYFSGPSVSPWVSILTGEIDFKAKWGCI